MSASTLNGAIVEKTTSGPAHGCPLCRHPETVAWLTGPDRFHSRSVQYRLRRCEACSIVWLENPPQFAEMGAHYTSDYHAVIMRAAESSSQRWKVHENSIRRFNSGGALLDVGCSSGSFLSSIKQGPWQLYGIEMSEESASRARERAGAKVEVGDIMEASFQPNSFDVVTSFDVLEHLPAPAQAMEKIWQWLKPGGIFYVFLPNVMSWEARVFHSYWYGLELPRHLYHFSPQSLRWLMSSLGFSEELLVTPPINYIEYSTRYICDDLLRSCGVSRQPLAKAGTPSFAWRALRKCWRLTALPAFSRAASFSTAGPAIEAVFKKPL